MAENSGVIWTQNSWGPWRGCRGCYAEREMTRFGLDHSQVVRAATRTFRAPLRWKEPVEVFVCPWSDFWIEDADPWRDEAFEIIRSMPQHTYLIPTKRPDLMAERLPHDWQKLAGANVWPGLSCSCQEDLERWLPQAFKIPRP